MKKSITMNKVKEKIQHLDEEKMYHVCQAWDGGDLLSLYEQLGEEAYDVFHQKYELDNGLGFDHVHYIHGHYTLEEAKEYQRLFGGQILVIDTQDLAVKHDCLEYPHPMVRDRVPKEYIKLYDR
jgi:hypothetical protein